MKEQLMLVRLDTKILGEYKNSLFLLNNFGQLISNKVGGKVGEKFKKIQKNALLDKKITLIFKGF